MPIQRILLPILRLQATIRGILIILEMPVLTEDYYRQQGLSEMMEMVFTSTPVILEVNSRIQIRHS